MDEDQQTSQGQALKDAFHPLKLGTAARRLGVGWCYIWEIAEGHKPMSPRVALLMEQHFPGRSAEDWLKLGKRPDTRLAKLAEMRKQETSEPSGIDLRL